MVFINTKRTDHTAAIQATDETLLNSLYEASRRALQLDQGILLSFIQHIEPFDAVSVLHSMRERALGECFFWEQPAKQIALLGCGSTVIIETAGETRFTSALSAWHALLEHALITSLSADETTDNHRPLLFGGFAFDTCTPGTNLWEGFPDGLLILPQLLLQQENDQAICMIHTIIQPTDDITLSVQKIAQVLRNVHTILENSSSPAHQQEMQTPTQVSIQDLRPAAEWKALVSQTRQQIQNGVYEKIVLARAVKVLVETETEEMLAVSGVLLRLKQSYPNASIFAMQRGERFFVGATPEQLVSIQNGQFQTMALAGSAPRGANEEEDRLIGTQLLQSGKNKDEHEIVVTMISQVLKDSCRRVWVSDEPHLLKLKNVQHLITPIAGELLPDSHILEMVASLHPTPAVGGLPRQAALQAIREGEQLDRGWYAGPIGWVDAHGNGKFAVALRSALIYHNEATLFAGCGIVADSDPESEYTESCLKLKVMLRGLGGED